MSRRLVLLRHGQTEYNATKRMQGQLDTHLSAVGVEQARAAALLVKDLDVVRVISSDLVRAKNTAEIVAASLNLPVEEDARLRETHLGQWQGLTHEEVDRDFVGKRAAWRHRPDWAPPGGESRLEVALRVRSLVDDVMQAFDGWENKTVLLVAHGGAIAAVTCHLLGLKPHQYPLLSGLKNTNISVLTARPRFNPEQPALDFTSETVADAQWYLDAWNQGIGG
ncbi:histidine phosphatase family protein [Corynebacterium cystitidis]|uniref:histidine phosphatase family protein n=1 Tax=Corynebacterium cystitidis TaxID=35757 RepID=UPI00211F3AC4|nr:histidine phosphatase family protein [Corynebacterium cystitidis]